MATFAEAAAYLDVIARRAEDAAEPVAIAMADAFRAYQDRTSKFFLLPPFIWRAISKGAAAKEAS